MQKECRYGAIWQREKVREVDKRESGKGSGGFRVTSRAKSWKGLVGRHCSGWASCRSWYGEDLARTATQISSGILPRNCGWQLRTRCGRLAPASGRNALASRRKYRVLEEKVGTGAYWCELLREEVLEGRDQNLLHVSHKVGPYRKGTIGVEFAQLVQSASQSRGGE